MARVRHTPTRTCVGCRDRDAQVNLVRLAVEGGSVVVDRRRRVPGRGAYLHPRRECLDRGLRRGAIVRSLRSGGFVHEGRLLAAVLEGALAT